MCGKTRGARGGGHGGVGEKRVNMARAQSHPAARFARAVAPQLSRVNPRAGETLTDLELLLDAQLVCVAALLLAAVFCACGEARVALPANHLLTVEGLREGRER